MFTLLLTCVLLSNPGNLEGKVVRIADGDTITVLVDWTQVKVRLSAIDAPERGQDFSQRSRQALADLVFGKEVTIWIGFHQLQSVIEKMVQAIEQYMKQERRVDQAGGYGSA